MRLKYWFIVMLAVIVAGAWFTMTLLTDEEYINVDMVDINERYQEVVNKLDKDFGLEPDEEVTRNNNYILDEETRGKLENDYQCSVILISDSDYEAEVNNSIRKNDVVLDYRKDTYIIGKIVFSGQQEQVHKLYFNIEQRIVSVFFVLFLLISLLTGYLYYQYIKPFKRLEEFAGCVSKGNFDFPLPMNKGNYFGAFTESFDMMREELKRARQSEYKANQSKKELVVSLSHDIKTPVSTIKALCEILEIKIISEAENEKIQIIEQKADVIDHLISDMFHYTLEDLEKLKITSQEELSTVILPMFTDINHYGKINLNRKIPECMVVIDALRLNQVIDNVINNSYKYADTQIDVSFEKIGHYIQISIQDYGKGICDDEMPLIFEKFYRGENAAGKDGSGLGLYLSKSFMEGMGGTIEISNNNGFLVMLYIQLA